MTKKDYIAIAAMFAATLEDLNKWNDNDTRMAGRLALHRFSQQFCRHAHMDNSRFDESRFMQACQWETT